MSTQSTAPLLGLLNHYQTIPVTQNRAQCAQVSDLPLLWPLAILLFSTLPDTVLGNHGSSRGRSQSPVTGGEEGRRRCSLILSI
jgi:hypothetical protein